MGKVIFLNQTAKQYHQEKGIAIKNPPDLKVIQGANTEIAPKKRRAKKATKTKTPRRTMGQRIYDSLQDE